MSKQRMVMTSLWKTSKRFRQCKPMERYLFLFLITNDDVDLCGAYEMMLEDIAYFTGLDVAKLPKMFERLSELGLAYYYDGWVIIPNYAELQNATNVKVQAGIRSTREKLPDAIREAIDRVSIDHPRGTSNINIDFDLDIDSNKESAEESAPPPPEKPKDVKSDAKSIIDHLNARTGRAFRYSDASLKPVTARLRDGFTVEDCKAVIELKAKQWLEDPKMSEYVCPQTLFRQTNFEKYLQVARPVRGSPAKERRKCPVCGAYQATDVCTSCGYREGDDLNDPENQRYYKRNLEKVS